jgi:outer membrane protein OmpA-like peptidoglycan-associated protein/tetratricopeptide (TPR) repeat protein
MKNKPTFTITGIRLAFIWLAVSCIALANAQNVIPAGKYNKKKWLKQADASFKEGSIFAATDLYLKILEKSPEEKSVLFNLAQSYFLARDYENAATYFQRCYDADSVSNTLALYYAALTTKMQGKYNDAIPMFKRFVKVYKEADASKMKKWARIEIDGCNFAIKEAKPDPFVKVTHLGKEVNSNYTDMSPALRNDELYFASINSDTVLTMRADRADSNKADAQVKLYSAKVNGDTYSEKTRITTFDEEGKHISNPSFNEEGNKLFYTICDGLLTPVCTIYMSEMKDLEWGKGKPLGSEVNAPGSSNTQPYLAKVNGVETLFFVSNREGSKGGYDIWYSQLNKKTGEFGQARNPGVKVNSDRDELTPFFDSKTNTLYFSSKGFINMGGSDIYKSQADASGRFNTTPENLGAPFNSPCDDNYFRYAKNSEEGYLVSNRPGIFSVRGNTCCYDIFSYKYDRRIWLAVKGRVIDEATGQPIAGAAINLSLRSDNVTESDVIISTDTSRGDTPYFFNLKPEKMYKVSASQTGYFAASQTFATTGAGKSDTLLVDIYMKKYEKNKAYRLNNIYYDFDKWDLRADSKKTLDTLYNILIENPTIIIELSSHTDVRGSDEYNRNLSQKRAESCVNYLINEKGIPKARITAKGYGETKTLEDCTKVADCPQDQSGDCPCHQLNRRTEFKVIGELDGKLIYENE